ncbi:MAG: hypothetical protein DMF89_02185 [Acidobacteria bacterium]|nr:MAG: hypothetical protein DMF89_02185 [Acidobacteriota bacterium]
MPSIGGGRMGDGARAAESRKIIADLLEADDLEDDLWLATARDARRTKGLPIFSELIRVLTHLRFSETEAESKWPGLLAHRRRMAEKLGRDPGLRLALFDWFVNIDPRLKNPKILEIAQFEKTEKSAMTDWLTGLYNRGAFRASGLRELRRAQRYRQRLSFLFFDLDDFKDVNDRFGHERGDAVLRDASRILRRSVRDVDICARYGGEEFAILLPETGRGGAAAVAERVRRTMAEGFATDAAREEPICVTVSGGVAVFPDDGEDLGDLLRRADAALYRAKAEGKNRIVSQFVERRLAHRFDLVGKNLTLTVRRAQGGTPVIARALDISRTGFGMTAPESLEIGEVVRITLDRLDRERDFDLSGRVVRRSPRAGPAGEAAFELGVDLEEASQGAADRAIEVLGPEHLARDLAGGDRS